MFNFCVPVVRDDSHKDDIGRDYHNRHDNGHVDCGHSRYSKDGDDDSMIGRSSRIWHHPSLKPQSIPII